eukprot:COSAG02_NODE_71409_length_191_cov_27.652174_2_plen_27_part_01
MGLCDAQAAEQQDQQQAERQPLLSVEV